MGPCNKYDSLADLNPVQFEDLQIVRVGEHPYRVHVFKYFPIFKLALVSIALILLSFEDLQCRFEDFKNLKNPHYLNFKMVNTASLYIAKYDYIHKVRTKISISSLKEIRLLKI